MNYVQVLNDGEPQLEASRCELRNWLLRQFNLQPNTCIDDTPEMVQRLNDHLDFIGDHHAILVKKYQELFDECPHTAGLFGRLGIGKWDVNYFQFFVARPGKRGIVHLDGAVRHCCLNMALFNGDKGTIQWFGSRNFPATPPNTSKVGTLGTYPQLKEDRYTDLPPDEEVITTGLQLVKTDIWHRVDNTDNPRFRTIFSLRQMHNPTFEDVAERLARLQ